jgi:chemotaxis protein MotB
MSGKGKTGDRGRVIIRREEVVEGGGHHGGAWKVAYADFVTAMMAFFLLMWLLNATTEAQRKGLADYFTPSNALSHASSGAGQPFGGHTPYDTGELVSDRGAETVRPGKAPAVPDTDDPDSDQPPDQPHPVIPPPPDGAADQPDVAVGNAAHAEKQEGAKAPGGGMAAAAAKTPSPTPSAGAFQGAPAPGDPKAMQDAAEQIRDAVRGDPGLADVLSQLAIDQTPQGLRIQLLDAEKQPMFATGSSDMNDRAKLLLQKIAPVLAKLSEPISIAGHTDAAPYKGVGKTNWDLSTERANATRRLLAEAGLQEERVRSVTGNADRDLLLPADPLAAANRRIAIVVLRKYPAGK